MEEGWDEAKGLGVKNRRINRKKKKTTTKKSPPTMNKGDGSPLKYVLTNYKGSEL